MKKIFVVLLVIATGVLITHLINRNVKLRDQLKAVTCKVDTVYFEKPYVPKTEFKNINIPKSVFVYRNEPVEIEKVVYRDTTVEIHTRDSTIIEYKPLFLTEYPNSPKLIQMILNDTDLSLTTMNPEGIVMTHNHNINLNRYQYNYLDGKLTFKNRGFFNRLSIVPEYMFRPVSNLHDLNLGIKYDTGKFSYELGLNVNYYPSIKKGLGYEPFLKLSYEF